ncbi:hypothetical protein O181_047499 [Austropuccinia psidii MF-1]|uniref:Uncharacterized protein n=1 Tax=Austropuccinia psidii MF-1 TaxID=1389203 RepID=A0A9Q3DQY1_9BASI|nr:hypothetical protein [Austropuccinia psidii MF-1]
MANPSSSISPIHPPAKIFTIQVLPSSSTDFQPVFSIVTPSIPHPSSSSSIPRPPVASQVRPSPIPHPRPSPLPMS